MSEAEKPVCGDPFHRHNGPCSNYAHPPADVALRAPGTAHPVYAEGPACAESCPGPWSEYHDGYSWGYEHGLAEARADQAAQIVALRDLVERMVVAGEQMPVGEIRRVLSDSASAAAEYRAEIERDAVQPLLQLLVRLRQYEHDSHDKGSDEQRARGDYGLTPAESCQNWFCYHVGVYLRHYGADALLNTPHSEGWTPRRDRRMP